MIEIIIGAIALVLILVGIWYEEKLIKFEDYVFELVKDRIAYCIAKVIVWHRRNITR